MKCDYNLTGSVCENQSAFVVTFPRMIGALPMSVCEYHREKYAALETQGEAIVKTIAQ